MTQPLNEVTLAQRLKAEGQAATPEFSPLLHARVMDLLRAQSMVGDAEAPRRTFRLVTRIAIGVAAAAGIAFAAWALLSPPTEPPKPEPSIVVNVPPVAPDALTQQVRDWMRPAATQWDAAKFGYLDRDARRLGVFVADQLPDFGVTEEKRR